MAANPDDASPDRTLREGDRRLERAVLRLVKGGPERRAIEAGEADAILDHASGGAFLLPATQRWLLERTTHVRSRADGRPLPAAQDAALLDGLPVELCALDAAGVVVRSNRAWRASARDCLGADVATGHDYLTCCDAAPHRVDGNALAAGIRQVIAGERRAFHYEHRCGARLWFQFTVTAVDDGGPARVLVLREDISARKHDEALLGLECAVARILCEAPDAAAALQGTIRAVCEALRWDSGRYFRFEPAAFELRCQESWGIPAPAVARFLEQSRGLVMRADAGLEGRVHRSGQPLWLVAGAAAPMALAPASDREGVFLFPVTGQHRALGVLAFSGDAIKEPGDRMLQVAHAIGSQLGRFLERRQALDAVRHSEARFRRLTELSTDCCWQQDRDFRFTECTGVGALTAPDALGKALWELPGIVVASADWAAHRAQLDARWSFSDFEFCALNPDGQLRHYCISGEPVFDEAGAFVGYWGTGLDITRRKLAERVRTARDPAGEQADLLL